MPTVLNFAYRGLAFRQPDVENDSQRFPPIPHLHRAASRTHVCLANWAPTTVAATLWKYPRRDEANDLEHRLNHNLRSVRTADVAAVPPAVGRGVLPLMLYERLIASAVMKEERSHCARRWVAGGEMGVDERRRIAV